MSNLSLDEGREWWRRLGSIEKDLVLGDVYHKQWSLQDMLEWNKLDPHSEKFCNSPYFKVLLEVINVIRKEVRRRQLQENLHANLE